MSNVVGEDQIGDVDDGVSGSQLNDVASVKVFEVDRIVDEGDDEGKTLVEESVVVGTMYGSEVWLSEELLNDDSVDELNDEPVDELEEDTIDEMEDDLVGELVDAELEREERVEDNSVGELVGAELEREELVEDN